jgi:hypothetical protein
MRTPSKGVVMSEDIALLLQTLNCKQKGYTSPPWILFLACLAMVGNSVKSNPIYANSDSETGLNILEPLSAESSALSAKWEHQTNSNTSSPSFHSSMKRFTRSRRKSSLRVLPRHLPSSFGLFWLDLQELVSKYVGMVSRHLV